MQDFLPGDATAPHPGAYARAALILLAFSLFATENLVHYPVALMAAVGIAGMMARPKECLAGSGRVLALMFACIWLPMLVASLDAVEPGRARETTGLYLHFLPAAYFVMWSCRDPAVLRLVTAGTAGLLVFAGFDAFAQLIWRVDMFGYPYEDGILKGVFYPKQRLGLFLAVFAPLYVDAVAHWSRPFPRIWLLLVPLIVVLVMSLKRAAWVMLLVGMLAYVVLCFRHGRISWRGRWLFPAFVAVMMAAITITLNPSVQHRLQATTGIFSADVSRIDAATSYRWTLWRTAGAMLSENWVTGVGPRGYRYAYEAHAEPDDFWLRRSGSGQTHPHLLILEVAVETGVIGLLGLAVFYIVLLREILRRPPGAAVPVWLICAATAWFPLNAHLAFYGSYWSTLVWLLVAIGLGAGHVTGSARRARVG